MARFFSDKELEMLLTAAGRAPSGGNAQPWLVEIEENNLTVKLNPRRLNTFIEMNNYDALFALGSFVENLEIAARHHGFNYTTHINHKDDTDNFSITLTFHTQNENPPPHPLYHAIFNRETNRQLATGKLIDKSTIEELASILTSSFAALKLYTTCTTQGRKDISRVLGKVDVYRTKIIKHHNRMMAEVRWTDAEAKKTQDGIDIKTMELPGNVANMLKLLRDHPILVKTIPNLALEKQTHPIIEHSSHVCCLATAKPLTPEIIFEAGKMTERIWLHTTLHHLAFCPWSVLTFFTLSMKFMPHHEFTPDQEVNLRELEKRFKLLLSIPTKTTPLFIFRLSYADPPSAKSLRYNWKRYTTII